MQSCEEVASQLTGHPNISLRATRETLQRRIGLDRAPGRALLEGPDVLVSRRCDRLEGDRGRLLFTVTQLHDTVDSTARWRRHGSSR